MGQKYSKRSTDPREKNDKSTQQFSEIAAQFWLRYSKMIMHEAESLSRKDENKQLIFGKSCMQLKTKAYNGKCQAP